LSDTFGQGALDPDAAALAPPPLATEQTQPPSPPPPGPASPPGGGPSFRSPLGQPDTRDPFAQPAWPEIADAAFRKSNSLASTLSFLSGRSQDLTLDPNWNPQSLTKGSEFENQPELFVGDLNKNQTAAKMARMRDENTRADILGKSGSAGVAMGLAAGVLDPINYLPIFGEYAAATRFGQVAYDAARLGAFGAATAGVSEAALHATQETRTWSESGGNIAGATLLMGMLGGTLGMLAPAERVAAARELDGVRPKVGVDPVTAETRFEPPPAELPGGLTVFHGSPEEFDAFDMSKFDPGVMGEGFGHYTSANERISGGYADPRTPLEVRGKGGNVYQVRIDREPDHFIDWNTGFEGQSDYVKERLTKLGLADAKPKYDFPETGRGYSYGEGFYAEMVRRAGSPQAASKELADAGIAGTKYFDPAIAKRLGLEDAPANYNYVVFNDRDLRVTHRNGRPVSQVNRDALAAAGIPEDEHRLFQLTERPPPEPAAPPAPVTPAEPPVRRPQTMLDWLKSNGGIKDEGGELSNRGLVRGYPGLVNNKSGMSLDVARRGAADAGFLGHDTDLASAETMVNDLLDRIDQHPTYSVHDEDQRVAYEVQQQNRELKAQYADAADQITAYHAENNFPPISRDLTHEASQLMVHEGLGVEDAVERAAVRSMDDEGRAIVRKGIPDHEIPDLDASARGPDEGGAAGERPGAEGQAGSLRGEHAGGGESAGIPRAVGAAASDQRDLELINFGLNQLGKLSEQTIDRLSPNLRVYAASLSQTAKRAMADLAETALRFTQHGEGIPTATGGALETNFRTAQKQMQYAAHNVVKEAWFEHRGIEGVTQRAQTAVSDLRGGAPEGKLSFKDFKAAVWDAMDQGDAHAIPQVQKAAQDIRKIVYDPTAKMAEQTLGPDGQPMLSEFREPPKGSQSFIDRIWNKQALIQKRPDVVRRFADYYEAEQGRHAEVQQIIRSLQGNMEKAAAEEARLTEAAAKETGGKRADLEFDARMQRGAQERIRKAIEEQIERWGGNTTKDALKALRKRTLAEERGGGQIERLTGADSSVDEAVSRILGRSDLDMSREELENLANETVDRILSTPDGRIPYEGDHITSGEGGGAAQQTRGSLNERRFAIPSQDVKDFLERDIEHVVAAHIRTVLPDVLLTQRFGDIRMTDQIRGILEDYAAKTSKEGISPKEAARLDRLKNRDIADVTAVRDRLRGTYGWTPDATMRNVSRAIHAFHNWTTITSLGTSALNRLNDWGMQSIFRNGFMNTLGDMWAPMLKGMLQIDKEGTREIVRQARDMGIGVDGMLGHARYNLADVTDNLRPGNSFERGLSWAADRSMIVNLHGPETDYARIFNWSAAQAEFGRVAQKISDGSATKKDFARMADASIDPHTASRIWAEYDKHAVTVGGTRLANTGEWTDKVARDAFERAMQREANINVVQAGIGDKPLFLSRPLGSLVGQFKSFTAGATERILIANLQQRDARTLQGLISGIAMGMLGYRLYTLASGQPVSDRPQDWIKEGIIRSGMGGWLTEGNNTLARFTSGKSDVFRAIGADRPSSRRASESALADLLGPTYSHLEGLTTAIGHATYTDPKTGASAFTARDIHNLRQAGVLPIPPFVFQNLMGVRRIGDEFEDGIARSLGIKPMNREPRWHP
jgi:hypothetical protein